MVELQLLRLVIDSASPQSTSKQRTSEKSQEKGKKSAKFVVVVKVLETPLPLPPLHFTSPFVEITTTTLLCRLY